MFRIRAVCPVLFLAVGFGPIYAQTNTPISNRYSPGAIPYGAIGGTTDDTTVTGQPFSAEINARKVQSKRGDGQIVYESHGLLARDSEGRVRREQLPSPKAPSSGGGNVFVTHSVTISDPVGMVQLRWDDQTSEILHKNTVSQSALPKRPGGGGPQVLDACERENGNTRSYPNGETQTIQALGERTIQGIRAQGCRVSTFIPVGAIRNEQAFTVTDDSWTSYDMHLTLLKTHHDPGMGEDETIELDNIIRMEPDPSLFQPPPGYEVQDLQKQRQQEEESQMPVTHPDLYAGPWETQDPQSGTVDGILLWLTTEVRQSTEYLRLLQIEVYHRHGGEIARNWFSTKDDPNTKWNGKQLSLKFEPVAAEDVALDLDLVFDPTQLEWRGTFARNGTARRVRLHRPGSPAATLSRFTGDWYLHQEPTGKAPYSATCIHIVAQGDGALAVWEDHKSARVINGPMVNEYGRELFVQSLEPHSIDLIMATSLSFGNRVTFTGSLSPDGTRLEGHWATNGNPASEPSIFIRSSREGFSSSLPSPPLDSAPPGQRCAGLYLCDVPWPPSP
jgi:hypothetical protein